MPHLPRARADVDAAARETGAEEELQRLLKRGLLSVAEQVVPLYAISKGYCVAAGKSSGSNGSGGGGGMSIEKRMAQALLGGAESQLLQYIRQTSPSLLDDVDSSRELSVQTVKTLDANLRVFFSLLQHGDGIAMAADGDSGTREQ